MKRFLVVLILALLLSACMPVAAECEWGKGGYLIDWEPKKGHLTVEFEVSDLECE